MKKSLILSLGTLIVLVATVVLYFSGISRNTQQLRDVDVAVGTCMTELVEKIYVSPFYNYIVGGNPRRVFRLSQLPFEQLITDEDLFLSEQLEIANTETKSFYGLDYTLSYELSVMDGCISIIKESIYFTEL